MSKRLEPERLPDTLRGFEGKWVAVDGDEVIAADHNPRDLVAQLHRMGPAGANAVTRYVPSPSDVIVIGVGSYDLARHVDQAARPGAGQPTCAQAGC